MLTVLVPARAARRRLVMALIHRMAERKGLDPKSEAYLRQMAGADLAVGVSAASALAFARRTATQIAADRARLQ